MIRSWKHKGLKIFYETGSTVGIQYKHREILRDLLFQLDHAVCPRDMNTPGNKLHKLSGKLKNHYSVWVSGNWRLTFAFQGKNAILVNYQDYH